ncbi:helix-turn-helix transcriptional regulator [Desulfosporosinus sp. PR]|uniref:helix-turn-helix transcriptional regulator n=1 Tax=Candidatus Desulfosporosinus nitrosoreducens TaxID=3401928 RepID=UPI0027E5E41A|nr:helix-turn-helix transcriptional regulator [Desulfosporosinus sp. PR]MDQ7092195.1 helix-turn-helix transcriptional regulator [Desulfosporosinus sp. PR]
MLNDIEFEELKKIAKGIAAQFGGNCEVVLHRISEESTDHSIVAIENGHVTGRQVGDGPSHVVLEQLKKGDLDQENHLCYLTKTSDGRILKSSTMYIRDSRGKVSAILGINYDISAFTMAEAALKDLIAYGSEDSQREPEKITINVNELLDDLIDESVKLIGKPAVMMNKDEKIKAIQFLNQRGAMLITKSGDKIAKYFGISKYTLYSYLDLKKSF